MSTLSVTSVNSFIDNAFVDDSADISSDETLFSISPSFGYKFNKLFESLLKLVSYFCKSLLNSVGQ